MSRRERHAIALLVGLALLGHALQATSLLRGRAPGALTLLTSLPAGGLAAHQARSARLARPLQAGERVDLNRAPAEEIARLPRVGMALAKAIVQARSERGGFASLAEVDQVRGVGPALLRVFDSLATLGDTARVRRWRPLDQGPARDAGPVNLNTASIAQLLGLRGIGPSRARAILAYRQSHGPFASLADLEKVPGLSPGLVRRLAPQVTIP